MWLEARYGWRILLYDLEEIEETIVKLNVNMRKRYSERVGESFLSQDVAEWTFVGSSGTQYWSRRTDWEVSQRGSIVADIEPSLTRFNPLLTSWELITFSFIIDWVINVGQWLTALSFLTFSTKHVAATGFLISGKRTTTLDRMEWSEGYSGTHNCSATHNARLTIRSPASVPLSPLPKVRLNTFKVMDLVAILMGVLSRSKYAQSNCGTNRIPRL